jgi:non-specific serine/threonine protein kinase
MSRVMISYRRSDSAGIAGRIFDRLVAHFGPDAVFMDVENIPYGVDFQDYINRALKTIDVVVAVMGPAWAMPLSDGSTRIEDPADPVRLELEAALARAIRVVPVLVDGAKMPPPGAFPQSLAKIALLNAPTIDSGVDFHVHIERLIDTLEGPDGLVPSIGGGTRNGGPSGNVPQRQSELIGRASDVVAVRALLRESPVVTVSGAGGVGKTRVALFVANDVRHVFGGAWFVDLAHLRSPGLVPNAIAATLGISPSSGGPSIEALSALLKHRHMLLVIDNCEHLIEEVAAVLNKLSKECPRVQVLATSREPLNLEGERVYRLPSLSLPPKHASLRASDAAGFGAVALFTERASAAKPDFVLTDDNASLVSDICRRLDGIALAIELAAARMSVFGLGELRSRLDERFRILTQGRRTALPRQQTMRATIDWSYDLLDERERALFRKLGAFPASFTLEGAVAVSGETLTDVADNLGSLVDKSLVLPEGSRDTLRYRLLESTRDYAREKLLEHAEHDAAQQGLCEWTLALASRAHAAWETSPSTPWFEEVKPEIETLRAALTWTLEQRNDPKLGLRIVAASRRIWGRVAPAEGKNWFRLAKRYLEEEVPAELVASVWLGDAHIHIALQEYKPALEAAERARQSYDPATDSLSHWEASGFAGCALTMLGRDIEAEPLLVATLDAYRRRGARQLTGFALAQLAFLHMSRDDSETARGLFQQALDIFQRTENGSAVAAMAINLAEIEFRAGHVEAAIEYGEAALSGSGDDRLSIALVNMAAYLVAAERWDTARDRARECLSRTDIARTEMDTILGVQHLAAVAALRPGDDLPQGEQRTRAARLLGFVDARLAALEFERQFTELREYDSVTVALREHLGPVTYGAHHEDGSFWDEARAISEAMLI